MKKTRIIQSNIIERKPPVNIKDADALLFSNHLKITLPEVNLFHYKNTFVTPEGIIFKGLKVDKQFLIYPYHNKIYNSLYVLSSRVKRKKINLPDGEKYLVCFDYWSNSIFHWMCDALPRLQAVKNLAKECIFLLPEHFKYSYIHETLKAFDFKSIHIFSVDTYLKCPDLYVPEQITTSGEINPENFNNLRKTLLNYFMPKFSGKHNYPNIYISRNKAKYRKVINEEEVVNLLKKYDFKVIHYEDYSVEEQIEIAYNTKNMLSVHGANLTNAIFMQKGGNMLEFRKKNDSENNYFFSIADSVGCNYYYMNCEYIDTKPGNFFDVTVDIKGLELILQQMLNKHY